MCKKIIKSIIICLIVANFPMQTFAGMGSFGSGGFGGGMGGSAPVEEKAAGKPGQAELKDILWDRETEGQIRIFCSPAARLYVDGELQKDPNGKKQFSEKYVVAVKAGKRKITMEKEGFITGEQEITVEAGKPYSMNFSLMKEGQKIGGMVLIPAGDFDMGLGEQDISWIIQKIGGEKRFFRNQLPRHKVSVGAFYIDKYEVTNLQYKKFVTATGHTPPEDWKNGTFPVGKDTYPVIYVTWEDAQAYAKWAGKRLPTEAEWEKAARGTENSLYPWGDTFQRNNVNTSQGGPGTLTPVGKYEKGKSGYGPYDMSGNVKEWTGSDFEDYPGNTFEDSFMALAGAKVARGGSFLDAEYDCLTTSRYKFSPKSSYEDVGFRCVKDAQGRAEKEISD